MDRLQHAAVLVLSLGVGGAFAVGVTAMRVEKLPGVSAPSQILRIVERSEHGETLAVRVGLLAAWRQRARSIVDLGGYNGRTRDSLLAADGRAVIAKTVLTTRNFFDVMGVAPVLGTTGEVGIILSHDFWISHFRQDERIVGRSVSLDGVAGWRVLAVAPRGFWFPVRADMWRTTVPLDALAGGHNLRVAYVVVRKRSGVSDAQVESELAGIAAGQPTDTSSLAGFHITPATDIVGGRLRRFFLLLMAHSVAFLCVAIASAIRFESLRRLASERAQAVRLALGATTWQLVSDGARASLWTSVAAAGLAFPLGILLATLLSRLAPELELSPMRLRASDCRYFLALTAVSALALSVAATRQVCVSITGRRPVFARQECTVPGGMRNRWIQHSVSLVAIAGATSVAIHAIGAVRAYARDFVQDVGWNTRQVLVADVAYPIKDDDDHPGGHPYARYVSTTQALAERLAALPGVARVSQIEAAPFQPGLRRHTIRSAGAFDFGIVARYEVVGPGFFATLGASPTAGREFEIHDRLPKSVLVDSGLPRGVGRMIVSASLARHLWGFDYPVGKRVEVDETFFKIREVVGVVDDLRLRSVDAVDLPVAYVPYFEEPSPRLALIVRLGTAQVGQAGAIQAALMRASPGQPSALGTVELVEDTLRRTREPMCAALALYAVATAMTSAICGFTVHSALLYAIQVRRREWAVRLALGGLPTDLLGVLIIDGLYACAAGCALGGTLAIIGSALIGEEIQSSSIGAVEIIIGSAFMFLITLLARYVAWVPIRQTNAVSLLPLLQL